MSKRKMRLKDLVMNTDWSNIEKFVTDNRNRTASEIRHVLSKNGGSLGETHSVMWQFDRKGVIYLKNEILNDDQELEIIDAGAEDINKEDGIQVITAMEDLQKVQEKLSQNFEIDNAELEYLPKNTVQVQNKEKIENFFEILDENDDINNFYSNAEL